MSIQVQRRNQRPATVAEWFARLAPKGLNTNTQFFLVFLAVLGLHLIMAPVFMRAAAEPESGEPQRYLTSEGAPVGATPLETRGQSAASTDAAERERLILADGGEKKIIPAPAETISAAAAAAKGDVPSPTVPAEQPAPAPEPKIGDLISGNQAGSATPSTKETPPVTSAPILRAQPTTPPPPSKGAPVQELPAGPRQFRTLP